MGKDETLSHRVDSWHSELVDSIVNQYDFFETQSDYTRFSELYVAEEILGLEIDDEDYREVREKLETTDWNKLYGGAEVYFSGLLGESEELAEQGISDIREQDARLGDQAEEFFEKVQSLYWK